MAASRSAAPPCSARPTGSTAPAASRASCACPAPPASSAPRPGSRAKGATRTETRYFISSRALTAADAAAAVRGHWAIENRLHWVLDVTFADDQSRLRKGHGARNMATVRHFALNLVRTATDKRSIKSRRKIAGWDPDYLDAILSSRPA